MSGIADHRAAFVVTPGTRLRLADVDPSQRGGQSRETAIPEIARQVARLKELQ